MKYGPHSNLKNPEIPGIGALREAHVDMSATPNVVAQMLSTAPGSARRPKLGYYFVAAAAAAVGGALLLPRKSSAMSIQDVARAARRYTSWYEQTYRPDKSGKLQLVIETWCAPGKLAEKFDDGTEFRSNGKLSYDYWPAQNRQRITPWERMEIPLDSVEGFAEFKLLAIRREGKLLRYVFDIHQDLLVDPSTKLPVERDVYHEDGSILEIHKHFFGHHLDERLFEPDIKPDVPFFDIPAEQAAVNARLVQAPQKQVVGGVELRLYAVLVDDGGLVGAVVSGGSPGPQTGVNRLQIAGIPAPPWSSRVPGETKWLNVNGRPVRLETGRWTPKQAFPSRFMLRVPVWKSDFSLVGWAEFDVSNAILADQIEEVLPNFVPEDGATGSALATADVPKP